MLHKVMSFLDWNPFFFLFFYVFFLLPASSPSTSLF
jgi:hypothetical protein